MPVHTIAIGAQEDRPVQALADGQIDRPGGARGEWDGDQLAALTQHGQGAVPALETEIVDVRAQSFGSATR